MEAIERQDVIDGYRILLGREPESESAIQASLTQYADKSALYRAIALSHEFHTSNRVLDAQNHHMMAVFDAAYWAPKPTIEHDVPDTVMVALLDRIRDQWTQLGEVDPHWSVLTQDNYRAGNLTEESLQRFEASGQRDASFIEHLENRTGTHIRRGVCLELGCGVGRITRFLAESFDKVIGVDISPGNLSICDSYLARIGIENVETLQVNGVEDFASLPDIDFFYSVIVLQHNSPPIQKSILRSLLNKIRPGGGALFQIPTETAGYSFDVDAYLQSESPQMEGHCLPKWIVLDELHRAGLVVVDVMPDVATGSFGSYTFYAVKPGE